MPHGVVVYYGLEVCCTYTTLRLTLYDNDYDDDYVYIVCSVLSLQVFFVVRLHFPSKLADLPPVNDPDALIANDLMDGRDAFLMLARDKHYEFSSLRRAKFSSMAMLYELHTQARDSFVYTCNSCHANVDTRYHCSVCDVSHIPLSLAVLRAALLYFGII